MSNKTNKTKNKKTTKFEAQAFAATKWATPEDKAKFANQFAKFVEGDYQCKHFPKWFYRRLHLLFGHIAHYNEVGFYEEFFLNESGKAAFEKSCLAWRYTHSDWGDVEQALQHWLREKQQGRTTAGQKVA